MKMRWMAAGLAVLALAAFTGCGKTPPEEETKQTLSISDVTAWTDCPPTEFFPVFSDPAHAEALTYEYDETRIALDATACTVRALSAGTCKVRAFSEHFSAEFTVDCRDPRIDITEKWRSDVTGYHNDWPTRIETFKALWQMNGTEQTTVFAGDSFFDSSGFWTDFYDVYAGKDVLCFGIGSTHSYNWEYLADALLADMTPRNLVMHIGTNNVYDQGDDRDMATEGLQRMFTVLHDRLPDTHIWWFTISQRSYDEMKQFEVEQVNRAMLAWCGERSWITCVDTSPLLTYDKLKDSIHPTLESYSIFVDALAAAGIDIADK